MSHKKGPYRLKADSRQQIEDAIPFGLYREDEQGNEQQVFATEDYSYVFLTNHNHDYALADLQVYDDTEIDFGNDVEVLTDIETPMHGWT